MRWPSAAKNDRNVIRIYSEGHGEERINLEKLEIVPAENGTTAALIRGIAAGSTSWTCGLEVLTPM